MEEDTGRGDHRDGRRPPSRPGHHRAHLKCRSALAYAAESAPDDQAGASGDFGRYLKFIVDQCTDYSVPIKKLRWKDDRAVAMRGNDVIAIRRAENRWYLLESRVEEPRQAE